MATTRHLVRPSVPFRQNTIVQVAAHLRRLAGNVGCQGPRDNTAVMTPTRRHPHKSEFEKITMTQGSTLVAVDCPHQTTSAKALPLPSPRLPAVQLTGSLPHTRHGVKRFLEEHPLHAAHMAGTIAAGLLRIAVLGLNPRLDKEP